MACGGAGVRVAVRPAARSRGRNEAVVVAALHRRRTRDEPVHAEEHEEEGSNLLNLSKEALGVDPLQAP